MENKNIKVCWLTCTKGRHSLLERNVKMFLDQVYENKVMLIYNNSNIRQDLDNSLLNKNIILVNKSTYDNTGQAYTNLGEIYNDAIKYVPHDVDLIVGADDDDIYFPNHISEGVKGYLRGKELNPECKAYKPAFSYYKYLGSPVSRVSNILEPSIFVELNHLLLHGYYNNTENQHHKWLNALKSNIYVDENGPSTYLCDWSQEYSTWKTSGDPHNPENFNNYFNNSQDHGDNIITPMKSCQKWYDLIIDM